MQKLHKLSLSLILSLSLVACGGGLSGTYSDGSMSYDFQSGGKVIFSVLAGKTEMKTEGKYERDGDKVKIIDSTGKNEIMTLTDGNTLSGALGVFKKQ